MLEDKVTVVATLDVLYTDEAGRQNIDHCVGFDQAWHRGLQVAHNGDVLIRFAGFVRKDKK